MDYKPKTSAAERAQLLTRQRALDYDAFNLMRMVLMDLGRAEAIVAKLRAGEAPTASMDVAQLGLGPKGPTPMCAECGEVEATQRGILCDACREVEATQRGILCDAMDHLDD